MTVRTVLVTGSSSGIGRATTLHLLEQGCTVIGIGRDHARNPLTHSAYHPYTIDLGQPTRVTGELKKIWSDHPGIDGIISNAGHGRFGQLENYSPQQITDFFNVNLLAHVLVARSVVPRLKAKGAGDLILMGSESALQGAQRGSLYCTAKFALRGLAQSLRAECSARGVRVTIINPGMVRTPFFDELKFSPGPEADHAIEAQDVAEAIWFALSARRGTVIDEMNLTPQKRVIDFGGGPG